SCGCMLWRLRGKHWVTIILKATFRLVNNQLARLVAPSEIVRQDQCRSAESSLERAGELAPYLPNVGVMLSGHAYARGGTPAAAMSVRLALLRERPLIEKTLHIVGDRLHPSQGFQPFLKMPLIYERAYGGPGVPDNPVGVGATPNSRLLPNIIDAIDPRRPA